MIVSEKFTLRQFIGIAVLLMALVAILAVVLQLNMSMPVIVGSRSGSAVVWLFGELSSMAMCVFLMCLKTSMNKGKAQVDSISDEYATQEFELQSLRTRNVILV